MTGRELVIRFAASRAVPTFHLTLRKNFNHSPPRLQMVEGCVKYWRTRQRLSIELLK